MFLGWIAPFGSLQTPSSSPLSARPLYTLPFLGVRSGSLCGSVGGTAAGVVLALDTTEAETWLGSELHEGGWLEGREGSSIHDTPYPFPSSQECRASDMLNLLKSSARGGGTTSWS